MTKTQKSLSPIEADFSAAVRKAFDGWIERIEKARGTSEGMPDLVMLLPSGLELCELKIGSVVDGVLWPCEVRPSQIRLHHDLANKGGKSFFLAGVWIGGNSNRVDDPANWRALAFDGSIARFWDEVGYEVGQTCFEIDMGDLYNSLADFVFEQLEN